MPADSIHVHVWNTEYSVKPDPIEEVDLRLTDEYDDHYQYSGMVNGAFLEVRVWK